MSEKEKTRNDRLFTRREALEKSGRFLAGTAVASMIPKSLRAKSDQPNIIFILTDDHRWDMLGCMGHPFLKTPAIDSLAENGTLFENAFVTTSLCSPSRASFLTGQYAHTHGVKNNLTYWKNDNITFLELMKQSGYDTAFIGKWHMPGKLPDLRGVDRFVTFTAIGGQGKYFNCPMIVDGKEVPSRKPYITEELTDYALEYINQKHDNPFCMYLSHKAVHYEFHTPEKYNSMYRDDEPVFPPEADDWVYLKYGRVFTGFMERMSTLYRNYCQCVTALDDQLARVFSRLEELGIADNTVIVYAGDNGYFWGEHRLFDKRWAYEESIRVPFIVKHPAIAGAKNRRVEQMALNIDLAPTILDMAGVPVPGNMEGESLMPIIKDNEIEGRDAWLYEYFKDFPYRVPDIRAVRTDRYKYITYLNSKRSELYDLQKDPREMKNIIGTSEGKQVLPGLQKRLRTLVKG
jgi:N-acetylglucosamine-6-sulfatase